MEKRIGLIAGSGQFPLLFARAARQKGLQVYAAAYLNEALAELEFQVAEIQWLHLGQLRRLIKFFKSHRVNEAVIIGAIRKTRMFSDVRPDTKALMLLARMKQTGDDGILRSFAGLLEKEGITIQPSTFLLPELLAPAGCWTRRKPKSAQQGDIALGWRTAKAIGALDIGQCVVTGGGSVLAVEAMDGTDATLKRGGKLGRGRGVAVKVCKPHQDFRFDVPAVGAETVQSMVAGNIPVLIVEAQKAVVFDRPEMVRLADAAGKCIVGMTDADFSAPAEAPRESIKEQP
jgi:DUF1009 family protein